MELHFVGHALTEVGEPRTHQRLQLGESVDVQRGCTTKESERRNEPYQPEAMVAMQMRDKDVSETRETESCSAILALRTLTTINHIEFVSQVDDLRGGIVARRGFCRATSEDMYFKFFHFVQK